MKRSNFHGIFSIEKSTRRLKKKKEKEIQSTVQTRSDNIRGRARSYVVEYRHKDVEYPEETVKNRETWPNHERIAFGNWQSEFTHC